MHMNKDLIEAKKRLIEGGYTCVVMKNEQIYTSTERGVKPLLAWLDDEVDLQGYSAADKVIGKGADLIDLQQLDVQTLFAVQGFCDLVGHLLCS